MKTSPRGVQFVMDQEGVILHPYEDQTGNWTIGVGHLIQDGENFPPQITKQQAMDLLASDLDRFEQAVNGYGMDLSQNQFDVLVDFSFNCGERALDQLLSHGLDDVPNQLPKWVRSKGVVVSALVRRRQAEIAIWVAPDEETQA